MIGEILRVLAVMAVIGLAAQPIAARLLAPLPGWGAGLARPLGLLLAAVPLWLLVSVGVVPYTDATAWLALAALMVAGAIAFVSRPPRAGITQDSAPGLSLLVASELVFLIAFVVGVVVVSHEPDIWRTEKPMDMAFLSALDNTRSFPPNDPWLSGEDLNYYYLGHYLIGFVVRVAGLPVDHGYNLAVALVWALAAAAAFGLGAAALASLRRDRREALLGGSLVALLAVVGGNVEGLRRLVTHDGPLVGEFDWFSATRVVPGGVNDFPAFELVLGDLHAHVIAVPFTLLALAFALHTLLHGVRLGWGTLAAAAVVGALYPMNAWSFPVVLAVLLGAGALTLPPPRRMMIWAAAVGTTSVLVYLPFHLGIDPGSVRGVAVNDERRTLIDFAADLLRIYGFALVPLLVLVGLALPPRARGLGLGLLALPPLALAGDLGGPALLLVALVAALVAAIARDGAERFGLLLAAAGFGCALLPELVYLRDAFEGTENYRFNTHYKLGFEAWLLFGVAAGILLATAVTRARHRARRAAAPALLALALAALSFPYAAAYSRTDGYGGEARLDGLRWLDALAPGDRPAIKWLRAHTRSDAVVLEATGPEYSELGHARISTFSGRPTVLGWAGHELFWGPPERLGTRPQDVAELYATADLARTRALLRRYRVAYVVVGPTERASYPRLGLDKFPEIARRVFDRDGTAIYSVLRTPGR